MFVTKKHPGGSSHGYQWPKGGEFIEMSPEHAHELVTIQPGEFEAVPELPKGAKAHVPPTALGRVSGRDQSVGFALTARPDQVDHVA
ncbi:hypothetical protein F7Q99_20165 [Streptomyces kaniharaensis]|uniref:Uncharacterized protein n=1 Tax=Streptomyces kaniharaensis TaxID=212423 RepID=A0A6N7KSC9_9ACTN|nr:hypothetical protein [Streptomyces kaniharaensis]MQS14516.1 hypothetical protein [Streptomyces kaniharaensis]